MTKDKLKKAYKKTRSLLKNRSYKNFYRGKSLPKTAYITARFVYKRGPLATYKEIKGRMNLGSLDHIMFPNGLISGTDQKKAVHWYDRHSHPVSIVIPSYNDYDYLAECISSIRQHSKPRKYHIFLVDDYCKEANRNLLRSLEGDDLTLIFRKTNGGFAKAVNTGLRMARKTYPKRDVVLLNSDILAKSKWLECLQFGAYVHHKNVGIVGPKLLYPDGRIQSAGSHRNTGSPLWFDHYYRFQPENYGPANVPQYCTATTGAAMYIKMSTINKIGLFDEKFPFAFEDVDYCLRAWQAGIRTLYFPSSCLIHVESASRSKNAQMSSREKASIDYFWKKWANWFDRRNVKDKNNRIKIIYVLQSTGVSGGIRIVLEHVNRLSLMGYNVELWSLDDKPKWMQFQAKSRKFKSYDTLIEALSKVEAIKVATWWETALPVWLASVNKGIPVYFIQEIESWFYPNDAKAQRSVISCYRKEFKNLTSSGYNLQEIMSLGLTATKVACGYDDSIFKPRKSIKRDANTLLALGRSFFQKNFKQTLEAWKLIERKPKLLLYGSEPDIVDKSIYVDYKFRPTDEEVAKLFNQATIFAQTSYHEGFCLPVLEAMASGCPVITTDSHGNRDFCFDNKNCIIVEKDDPVMMSKKIKDLLNDKKLQRRLSIAGLATAKQYQWDVIMKKIENFYIEVAAQTDGDRVVKELKKL